MSSAAIIACIAIQAPATQSVAPFKAIENSGPIDIEVRVDPNSDQAYTVELEASEEVRERVEIAVENETLEVETKKKKGMWGSWYTNDKAILRVTVKELTQVVLRGSGDLRVEGMRGDDFALIGSGSGDANIEGEIGDLQVTIRGSGDARIERVDADSVEVDIKGSGDLDLAGRANTVSIQVYGSGDVDARRLEASDAQIQVYGSGDITICASGDVRREARGSGKIEVDCS